MRGRSKSYSDLSTLLPPCIHTVSCIQKLVCLPRVSLVIPCVRCLCSRDTKRRRSVFYTNLEIGLSDDSDFSDDNLIFNQSMKTIQVKQTQHYEQQVGKLKWKQELLKNIRTKQEHWIKNRLAEGKKQENVFSNSSSGQNWKQEEEKLSSCIQKKQERNISSNSKPLKRDNKAMIQGREARIQGGESRIQGGESRIQGVETRLQGGESIQVGESRIKVGESRIQGGESMIQGGESRLQGGEARIQEGEAIIQGGESRKQGGESRIQGGESRLQGGESRIQEGEARIQGGESRIQVRESRIDGKESRIQGEEARLQGVKASIDGEESRLQGGEDVSKIPNGKSRIEEGYIHTKHWYEETSKSCGNYTHATGKLCGGEVGNLPGGEGKTNNIYSHGISVGFQPSCGTDMTSRAPPTRTRTRIYRDKSKERTLLSSKNSFNSSFKKRNEENKKTRLGIAIADNFPSPYDKDGLPFRQGDCIEIISMDATGLWRGKVGGRIGVFKFIYVRVCTEEEEEKILNRKHQDISLEEFLCSGNLSNLVPILTLNGYDTLNHLVYMSQAEFEYLGICSSLQKTIFNNLNKLSTQSNSSNSEGSVNSKDSEDSGKSSSDLSVNSDSVNSLFSEDSADLVNSDLVGCEAFNSEYYVNSYYNEEFSDLSSPEELSSDINANSCSPCTSSLYRTKEAMDTRSTVVKPSNTVVKPTNAEVKPSSTVVKPQLSKPSSFLYSFNSNSSFISSIDI